MGLMALVDPACHSVRGKLMMPGSVKVETALVQNIGFRALPENVIVTTELM
jgi:hypothetical protein